MSFKFVCSWLMGKTLLHWVVWSSKFSAYTDRSLIHHTGLNSCIGFQKLSEITSDTNIHIWRALLLTNNCMIFEVVVNYTGSNRRNVRDFGRVFLMLKYTDITQNTYIQSWMVMEIMAGEVWNFDSCYSLIDYQIRIETGRNMWFL